MQKAWVIRPNPHGISRIKEFMEMSIVAIGWPCIGLLEGVKSRNEVKEKLKEAKSYNYSTPQSLGQAAGTIYRFVCEVKQGDYVLVPNGSNVIIGRILSNKTNYLKNYDKWEEGFCHHKKVEWLFDKKSIERRLFTSRVYDSLKGQGTLFNTYFEDIHNLVTNKEYLFIGDEYKNTELKKQYLKKMKSGAITGLNSNHIEEMCCVLLNKYFPGIERQATTNTKGNGDTDLKAELIGEVVIRIQIKNFYEDRGSIEPWVVTQLADSMDEGDNGIVLTTTTISTEAKEKAREYTKNNKKISFIDGEQFIDLLFSQIDSLSREELIKFGLETELRVL